MKPIFLIGYMGSGKSTLGRALAARLGLQFIDLDQYIEGRYHTKIRDIFAAKGEEGFRDMERRMLAEVSAFEDVIVACGGGTPCFYDNMEVMNSSGLTVLLDASVECLHRRLLQGRTNRPLIATLTDDELRDFIITALEARRPHYSRAAIAFASDLLEDRGQIAATVERFIAEVLPATSNTENSPR
ncbi:MAG: shikimate kinase [Candidatus Amulumruptor caecigallinarius]|nr:shikimate kinase [Candidatus Amulumruptor caecigallinarius]MCM1396593.1 shikimate kinase [Candidatus Amulumruptor caecigallinarius]MCM1453349.1 shikimate kinase [bacterium]